MIELTYTEFNRLIVEYNLTHINNIILTKEILDNGDSIATLDSVSVNIFEDILVFKADDFYFCNDISQLTLYGRLNTGYNIHQIGDSLVLDIDTDEPEKFVVIYFLVTTDAGSILEHINLVSVDYVSSDITHIQFGGSYNNLTEINLSGNKQLGNGVLENLSLNKKNLNYGNHNVIDFIGTPFAGTPIKKFVFPSSGASYTIPAGFFAGCTELEEVYIPDDVISIGANAFKNCSKLQYVHIGRRVQTIGAGAFDGCTYPTLTFDVSYDNTDYFGEVGALIKGPLEFITMELVHATNAWFDSTLDSGISNCHVVRGDTQSLNTGSFNMDILVGMYTDAVQGGTETVVDVNGNTIHNLTKITGPGNLLDNLRTQFPNGALNSHFYIPMYQIIYSIGSDACVGDTNIRFTTFKVTNGSYNWFMLRYIGDRAFKGCTNLSSVDLPGYCNQYYDSPFEDLFIGVSAFEGCTILSSIQFYKYTALKTKSFFGCTNLHQIYCDYPLIFEANSSLWFGNTPSLEEIVASANYQNGNVVYYNNEPANAIVNDAKDTIMVGCKNTNFSAVHSKYSTVNKIGDYAFYGCTDLMITEDISSHYPTFGDSAFYNCISLVATSSGPYSFDTAQYIGANAFYGCIGLQYLSFQKIISIGSKAFGNTGITYLRIGSLITNIANDAFDNCPLATIIVSGGNNSVLDKSIPDVENSLLKKINGDSTQISLIKSGDGKAIVNERYDDKPVVDIQTKAFSGVNLNSGQYESNDTISIPPTVESIGSNIFTGSTLDNDVSKLGTLKLYEGNFNTSNVIVNDPNTPSIGLMYLIGAKYFKKIVEDTYQNRLQHKIYYNVEYDGRALVITECMDGGVMNVLGAIETEAGDIHLQLFRVPDCQYASGEFASHEIDQVLLILMKGGQILTPEEQIVYFDPGDGNPLVPGTMWCDILIPNDISYTEANTMNNYYNPRGNAFADCDWISGASMEKKLSNMKGVFKHCTSLQYIEPSSYEVIHGFSHPYDIFDGIVPESAFERCGSLLTIAQMPPIKYEKNAFLGCVLFQNTNEYLKFGTSFKSGSFAAMGLNSISLNSPTFIDPQAFIDNNLIEATADNSCGYYFTGCGKCIIDSQYNIVVGTLTCDFKDCQGIGPYAFYGRLYNMDWTVTITDKHDFNIGESAFAESNIPGFFSRDVSNLVIGKNAFSGCGYLEDVEIKNGNTTLGQGVFSNCKRLTTLILPSNIQIPKYAFMNCSKLSSVNIGNTVSQYAFSGCGYLEELHLEYDSSSLAIIHPSAFIGCPINDLTIDSSASTINYHFNTKCIYKYNSDGSLEIVIGTRKIYDIDECVTLVKVIGKHAFNGRGLEGEITIPGSVTKIDDYAFANNPGITYVNIPPTVEYIGAHAFDGCTNLISVTLPDSCTFIGEGAFKGCSLSQGFNCNTYDERYYNQVTASLNETDVVNQGFDGSLDLSKTVCFNDIAAYGFAETNIRIIKLPTTIRTVGDGAFKDCASLTEVHFYNGLITIGKFAFYGCVNLYHIYLHDSTYAPEVTQAEDLYNVGASQNIKQLHLPSQVSSGITSSLFYLVLVNAYGFIPVYDLDI